MDCRVGNEYYENSFVQKSVKTMKIRGAAKSMASILSRMPPCPGSMFPESLVLAARFKRLSKKSPKVAKTETQILINAIAMYSAEVVATVLLKNNKRTMVNAAMIKPPIKPSHVFFGETVGNIKCFPNRRPEM